MQFVGYEPTARGPALIESDGESIVHRPIERGDEFAYTLGSRRCAGTIDHATGTHHPCDRSRAPYCAAHSTTWVCARCTGTCLKDEMDCFDEHAVYLAAFAPDTFKVGVTRLERLETRLREQGADRAAHVHTVSNGRIARELEAEIARDLDDRVSVRRKIDGLAASVDEPAWESLLESFGVVERFAFDYGFELPARPVRETIATGTVVGIKGRVLVLEQGGTNYAVDMRELVGHEVEPGRAELNRQSSLGSFGSSE